MAPRTTETGTSDRIVVAATSEFATYGIAGARVERIARAAQTSKERVYAHFRGKDELYRFVAGRELEAMAHAVELDPSNLGDYAGRLLDHAVRHPERHRLMLWGQLELPSGDVPRDDPVDRALGRKIARLREAQEAGTLDSAWAPEDILVFVTQLATSWVTHSHLIPPGEDRDAVVAAKRRAIVAAVERLFPPRL